MPNVTFYRCKICGNVVALLKNGGGTLTCCGQPMTKLEANTTEAVQEKHIPAITRENGKLKVTIGSILHPMEVEHHIEWIALVTEDKVQFVFLKPGMQPIAEFEDVPSGAVYEYCNLHGLWKAEF
ncbi:desulfoferrodoxin family protein [Caproiciproducens sp. LBM24188]|jgi:superoxide reductase|nr:desulfoferrodoxin FeS4 iron-binding domain-containing protein [Oscillospiraceae bacterium]HHV32669.1 desulfoferrodoxin FeS4 iron-binding domain-containing protein [Clostridiales bacterium]